MTEAAPQETPKARIVSPKERSASVPLDWPVEFDGKTYDSITIRRISAKELELFVEAAAAQQEGQANLKPPMIDCPVEVYEEMDADDRAKLEVALLPFLPRSLRAAAELIRSASATMPEE